jgi:hypothetical protein
MNGFCLAAQRHSVRQAKVKRTRMVDPIKRKVLKTGGRRNGDGRSATNVWSANWRRRNCHVVL